MAGTDWNRLSRKLKEEVAKQDRVRYITTATLPEKYVGFENAYAFQLNDGTIYLITDAIKESGEDIQDVLKHEMAHRVLGHTQPHEEGEELDVPINVMIKGMPESLRHEVDVNLLLHKTYGFPSATKFSGEVGGWMLPYAKEGNVPYGDIFTIIRKEILDRQDVPSEWKSAVIAFRRRGAKQFANNYGYSVEYADDVLDYGKEPDEFNDLVKHVWFGMVTPTDGDIRTGDTRPVKSSASARGKTRSKRAKRGTTRAGRIPTQVRGLRR